MTKVCSKCGIEKDINEFHKNGKYLYSQCKTCKNKKSKQWASDNDRKEYQAEYHKKHKDDIVARKVKYTRERYAEDDMFRLLEKVRTRLKNAVYKYKLKKSKHTVEYLGTDIPTLMDYLQQTAIDNGYHNFDINSYDTNEYHIDHIIPFKAVVDGVYTLEEVCHYTNLQILSRDENLSKNDSY